MKKSEIKQILIERLQDKWDLPFGSYGGLYEETQKEFADDILNILEEAGMLPPTVIIERFGYLDNAWEEE